MYCIMYNIILHVKNGAFIGKFLTFKTDVNEMAFGYMVVNIKNLETNENISVYI
jgi:hypothetical protein